MANKEELKQVLTELKTGGDSAEVKAKAAEFLKNVNPKTLSLAEQELMEEEVVSQEELRSLCCVHLEVMGEELERQKPKLDTAHPVGVLMEEHKIILRNLEELRRVVDQVEAASGFGDIEAQVERLKGITHLLLDTESHHEREEKVLFPRLERHGVTGPPRIMRLEHEELRAGKRRLAELVEQAGSTSFSEFAGKLNEAGGYIADELSNHIFKEDNILYPTALETLEAQEWSEVFEDFEQIGYCCFTPVIKKI